MTLMSGLNQKETKKYLYRSSLERGCAEIFFEYLSVGQGQCWLQDCSDAINTGNAISHQSIFFFFN